ncbi:PIG-L family deacetylase [Catellatospora sp. KI3]|uniref:PIG-L family deacetylase n=1 Tax=Catellatospora sp. KI3 TaxID=3041620 RepID=UPI00248286F4|nr:PIG-L family deacetylase [Catellatospora sp. KI3]MDI1464715.1 PIG-L family deacetylase [Catellatospora sp. KI3]
MNIVAHEDDDIIFMNPDLLADTDGSACVRTVFLTAGDAGGGSDYWLRREAGAKAAYATMRQVADAWTNTDMTVAGKRVRLSTLVADTAVSLVFVRLPDGIDGSGTSTYQHQSLQKLWEQSIGSATAVDNGATFTRTELLNVLRTMLDDFGARRVRLQDYLGAVGPVGQDGADDHHDHRAGARFGYEAQRLMTTPHTTTGYRGYPVSADPANVTGAALATKKAVFYAYAAHDENTCADDADCVGKGYDEWLLRQYRLPPPYSWTVGAPAYTDPAGNPVDLANLRPGQTATVSLRATNTGTETWSSTGTHPIRLGTSSPNDRTSPLATSGWQSSTRPVTVPGTVAPGQSVTLSFPIAAPDADTSGTERFNLIAEGVTWFTGAEFSFTYRVKPFVGIAAAPTGGYWLTATDGGVFAAGGAQFYGSKAGQPLSAPVSGIAASPTGRGYWLAARDGGVFAYGDAQFYGSKAGQPLNAPVVGIAATGSGHGYWLVAADGGVFAYGDAPFVGSMGGQPLNAPVVGITGTPSGRGYWLAGADGGVFAYGDAQFHGSMGGRPLNAPVTGILARSDGHGYWLVGADGGVFAYNAPYLGRVTAGGRVIAITRDEAEGYRLASSAGTVTPIRAVQQVVGTAGTPLGTWAATADGKVIVVDGEVALYGSMAGQPLNRPIAGIAATPSGRGYWLVGADGGVFSYGDAQFYGSKAGQPLNAPVVGISATRTGRGYWLVGADGGVFAYGDAGFAGSMGGRPLNAPVVGIAATPSGNGYWLVGADGGIFAFGNAGFHGSMGGRPLNAPITGILARPNGQGYWLVGGDGGVFAFDAPFYGSLGATGSSGRVVGISGRSDGGYAVVTEFGRATSFAAPQRIGVLVGDHYYVKEGSLGAGWVDEFAPAIAGAIAGDRIVVIDANRDLWAKDGALNAGWVKIGYNVVSVSASGNRIGVLSGNGHYYVEAGPLDYGGWTDVGYGVTAGSVAGNRIGVLSGNGHYYVREGAIDAPLVDYTGTFVAGTITPNRVIIVDNQGRAFANEGATSAPFTAVGTGVRSVAAAGQRLALVTTGRTATLREGGLTASETVIHTAADAVVLSPYRVGVLTAGTFLVQEGRPTNAWTVQWAPNTPGNPAPVSAGGLTG